MLYPYQVLLLVALFVVWQVLTVTEILPPFFFGRPLIVLEKTWEWFASGKIYKHLAITLAETVLAFGVGTLLGLGVGLWLALSPWTSALLDPYVKALNAMPRVILAPIFAVWFGLGIWSKVALGVTLVFFIVFSTSIRACAK
jgi:NitT/TauT family transport system permease protein